MIRTARMSAEPRKWRIILSGVVSLLVAAYFLLFTGGLQGLLSPWMPGAENMSAEFNPAIHRWHSAHHGALMGILFGGILLSLVWQPQKRPAAMQFYVLLFALLFTGFLAFSPQDLDFLIPAILPILAYPGLKAIFKVKFDGKLNSLQLALAAAVSLALLPGSWSAIRYQIQGTSEHAQLLHGMSYAVLALGLISCMLYSAFRTNSWRALTVVSTLTLFYLSIVSLMFPNQAGSWGLIGGSLAGIAGILFLLMLVFNKGTSTFTRPARAKV